MKKVVRNVSSTNLKELQLKLIDHPEQEVILGYINSRRDYKYERHDETVRFWFETGCPSWVKLVESLQSCGEGVLATKLEKWESKDKDIYYPVEDWDTLSTSTFGQKEGVILPLAGTPPHSGA